MNKKLNENIEKLNNWFEKLELEDLQYTLGNKKKLVFKNFLAGLSRGVGIGVGITIVTAIVVVILQKIVMLNIPVLGDYIADIIDILETKKY